LFITTKLYLILTVYKLTFCDNLENMRHWL